MKIEEFKNEEELRKEADEPTLKCLELWKSMCDKLELDSYIEVLIGNRHDHPDYEDWPGHFSTADMKKIDNKNYLILWLDSLPIKDLATVTHEVGHYILTFQGFNDKKIETNEYPSIKKKIPDEYLEEFFNSLLHHKPLYDLQKNFGHNPDFKKKDSIKKYENEFNNSEEKADIRKILYHSLILSDHFINNSKSDIEKLKDVLTEKHPETLDIILNIERISEEYNLSDPVANNNFSDVILDYIKKNYYKKLEWKTAPLSKAVNKKIKQRI
ncbi:MAG: hypothetical protein GY749_07195 [Desulfobacteraceae bacterium]|nr:hypothetical protein [Desulfobacteraceae bacterium]